MQKQNTLTADTWVMTGTFSVLYRPLRAKERTQDASTASGEPLSWLVCSRWLMIKVKLLK